MSDWDTLEWIGVLGGIATIIAAVVAVCSFFRRRRDETNQASTSGANSPMSQAVNSSNSMIVTGSPSAVVVKGDLNITGYPVDEYERIVKERVVEVRADLERAHQAEVDALRAQIAALTEPEWDKDTIEAVETALAAKQFDRAEKLMAQMEEDHLVATSISAAKKQVRIRQLRAAIALVNGDAKMASEHVEVAVRIIAPLDSLDALKFRNAAAMHMQNYGERVGGDGIVKAIKLYRINLGQLNRETLPEPWAETQHNLGNALLLHGMRVKGGQEFPRRRD